MPGNRILGLEITNIAITDSNEALKVDRSCSIAYVIKSVAYLDPVTHLSVRLNRVRCLPSIVLQKFVMEPVEPDKCTNVTL